MEEHQDVMQPSATMRLLETTTYELHTDDDAEYARDKRYAILSHRWLEDEITYDSIDRVHADDEGTPATEKILGACAKAREQGYKWIWLDSCCINKANAVEEQSAINTMFRLYRDASVCFVYLRDVVTTGDLDHFHPNASTFQRIDNPKRYSEWFERGWTLQELLAPSKAEFYDRKWQLIGTKEDLASPLSVITGIDKEYLTGDKDFRDASLATRLSWMAGRKTTKSEDLAYSMLGLFDTSMNVRYGEGIREFVRLERQLIVKYSDESIFAWKTPDSGLPERGHTEHTWEDDEWGLLAPSPDCFKDSGHVHLGQEIQPRAFGGYKMEQHGLMFPFPTADFVDGPPPYLFQIPVIRKIIQHFEIFHHKSRQEFSLTLNCFAPDDNGRPAPVQVHLRRSRRGRKEEDLIFRRHKCSQLGFNRRHSMHRRHHHPHWGRMTILQPEPAI